MLELPQGLGFDLTDTLTRDRELLANFLKCVVGVHPDAETHTQNAFFTRRQAGKHAGDRFLEVGLDRGIYWNDRILVFDEVTKMRIFFVTDRRLSPTAHREAETAKAHRG